MVTAALAATAAADQRALRELREREARLVQERDEAKQRADELNSLLIEERERQKGAQERAKQAEADLAHQKARCGGEGMSAFRARRYLRC